MLLDLKNILLLRLLEHTHTVCVCVADWANQGMPKQRYLRNQLWYWVITWQIFSPCTNIKCSVSTNKQPAMFSSSDTHVRSFHNSCYYLVHYVVNFIWLLIICPQLILCIPKVMLFHYRLAHMSFMCPCSRIGLSVLLNWPSGTEDKSHGCQHTAPGEIQELHGRLYQKSLWGPAAPAQQDS